MSMTSGICAYTRACSRPIRPQPTTPTGSTFFNGTFAAAAGAAVGDGGDVGTASLTSSHCPSRRAGSQDWKQRSFLRQDRQVIPPRADRVAELVRHRFGDLVQVVQVVDGPGGKELAERDAAEVRVRA